MSTSTASYHYHEHYYHYHEHALRCVLPFHHYLDHASVIPPAPRAEAGADGRRGELCAGYGNDIDCCCM